LAVNVNNEEVFKMKKLTVKLKRHIKELLEKEKQVTRDIDGYEPTREEHMTWLIYHADIMDLKVVTISTINGTFDGFAFMGRLDNSVSWECTKFMQGSVPDLIQYLVDRFNESHPLAA